MEIITRAAAKAQGRAHYFTGKPCKRGHLAERFVSIGTCKLCARENAMRQHVHTTERRRAYSTPEELFAVCRKRFGSFYDYSEAVYVNAHTPMQVLCKEHGAFSVSPTNHLQGKGCNRCGVARSSALTRKTTQKFIEDAQAVWGEQFDYSLTSYHGAKKSVVIICKTHPERTLTQQPSNHLSGQNPCPRCGHGTSIQEQELWGFLKQHTEAQLHNSNIIPDTQLDIWLPDYNMGIEYHGLYWHTTNKRKDLHRKKWELAQAQNIRLVQIFEDEWLGKQEVVKNRLLAFLGKAEKRDARKLKLHPIQCGQAWAFLNQHHIQGRGPAGVAYGLFDGPLLVAVATFGKSRSGAMTGARSDGEFEVLRYASIGTVRGGFTRLLAAFKREAQPRKIISYCDLRYGTGGLYKQAGFTLDSITTPDYWWVPPGRVERVPRYAVQKHKLANPKHELHSFYAPHLSEDHICAAAGWEKIHGVGSQKWVWEAA